jgi:hypothetical protein
VSYVHLPGNHSRDTGPPVVHLRERIRQDPLGLSSDSLFSVFKELSKRDTRVGRRIMNSYDAIRVAPFCHTFPLHPLLPVVPEGDTDFKLDLLDWGADDEHFVEWKDCCRRPQSPHQPLGESE